MSRLAPYLGVTLALGLGLALAAFFGTGSNSPAIPSVISQLQVATTSTNATPRASTPAPQTQAPAPTPTPVPAPAPATTKTTQSTQPSTAPTPSTTETQATLDAKLNATSDALRAALVNIICYAPAGGPFHSISGSGVIIDPKGIILTNAHVAASYLLANRGVSCTVRTGSPAEDAYHAALIYLSPTWAHDNIGIFTNTKPSGTGERDYAFLAITKSATSAPLPTTFPYLPLATTPPNTGTPVVIGSYGAQFLETSQVQSSLFPTIVFGSVKDVYTFGTNTIDVLALGGSAAAQEGSSGGGVANEKGELVGTITTSTVSGPTNTRSLDAITESYVRASYASENGTALEVLLAAPLKTSINAFASKIPTLETMLLGNGS